MSAAVRIRPEQILVVGLQEGHFLFGGERVRNLPWPALRGVLLYGLDEPTLRAMLADAVGGGWCVLGGSYSERRGLRGFEIGIGAWGWHGRICGRTVSAWAIEPVAGELIEESVVRIQARLRDLCVACNEGVVPFRDVAARWTGALYRELGLPIEPEGRSTPLPEDVAAFCRRAHVGGPIVHARTSLAPFCTVDRVRAYGQAMLEDLPSGVPIEVPVRGKGLDRWRPKDLMRAMGFGEATVSIVPGPCLPLLPLHQAARRVDRSRTFYPVGRFRGVWALRELAQVEEMGLGQVEALHRVVTFAAVPVLRDAVLHLRTLERVAPGIEIKRLEHVLYGRLARGLSLTWIGSAPTGRGVLPRDVLDERSLRRMRGRVEVTPFGLDGVKDCRHPVWQIHGTLSAQVESGSMDRPDRAAWVTTHNRMAMRTLVRLFDRPTERSGARIGRVYVDGLDVEIAPKDLPALPGATLRRSGAWVHLYRTTAQVYQPVDGPPVVDAAGIVPAGADEADLRAVLKTVADPDAGPLAGGRVWPEGSETEDPRDRPGVRSEPLCVDLQFGERFGFGEPELMDG